MHVKRQENERNYRKGQRGTWRMAFAFSKIAVTLTWVAGPGVLVVGFDVTVRLRLNDWRYITAD